MSKRPTPYNDFKFPPENNSFDVEKFDEFIRSHGVTLIHYKAIKCPIGLTDRYDSRGHSDHDTCSNGHIYKKVGEVMVLFMSNSSVISIEEFGSLDQSTVSITLPRFYDNSEKPVNVQRYDRMYLKEDVIFTTVTHLFEANQSGIDKLRYPVKEVEDLIDSHGKEYTLGDFDLVDGKIRWLSQNRPGYDPKLDKGTICSVRYKYVPFWYIDRLAHEIRVTRDVDFMTGKDSLVRLPQQAILKREYIFENHSRSENGESDTRDNPEPRSGSFGER